MKKSLFLFFLVLLTACSANRENYLPHSTTPIVNIEAPLNEQLKVAAESRQFKLQNLTDGALEVLYTLYWYDQNGVTQSLTPNEKATWHSIQLPPHKKIEQPLSKPTAESVNYRIYLRGNREFRP